MGQYFKALTIALDDEKILMKPTGSAKLMEHAWFMNSYVNKVYASIKNFPRLVAWIGDYSNQEGVDIKNISKPEFQKYYEIAHSQKDTNLSAENIEDTEWEHEKMEYDEKKKGFLVNHSKSQYIDLAEYLELNKEISKRDNVIDPLPILTACGNGLGGGDYEGIKMELVGSWAFDLITFSTKEPELYECLSPVVFVEGFSVKDSVTKEEFKFRITEEE